MPKNNRTIWIGLIAAVFLCGCATQDDMYALDHRLSILERKNVELEKQNRDLREANTSLLAAKEHIVDQVKGLNKTRRDDEFELRGQYAGLAAQLESLRKTTQIHTGRLEEMDYLLNQKLKTFEEKQSRNQDRMNRISTDSASIQKRVGTIEQYLNMDGGKKTKTKKATPPVPKKDTTKTAQNLYQAAKKKFDAGEYEAARKDFEKLVADHPQSSHADNSQFWIGETYYREKWYEKAILEYQKVIENYPSGNKTPAALLKQGLSFLEIGETNNARLLLKDLVNRYPGSNESEIAKKKLESL